MDDYNRSHEEISGDEMESFKERDSSTALTQLNFLNDQNTLFSQVKIYPNPTLDEINIEGYGDAAIIEVMTSDGKTVKSFKPLDYSAKVSLNDLPAGVYVIKVLSSRGKHEERIIKH